MPLMLNVCLAKALMHPLISIFFLKMYESYVFISNRRVARMAVEIFIDID